MQNNLPKHKTLIPGIVTDCLQVNVHKKPKNDSEIVTTVDALSEVSVNMGASTNLFYRVYTADGAEGFCMKKYIALKH